MLFPFLKANDLIFIYSTEGRQVLKKTIPQDGEYSFSLSQLTSGIYLVKINMLTYKIVKR